jgi:hypothetical protein
MNKSRLFFIALLVALGGPVLAQGTAAPAAKSSDATVQMRAERRAADEAYKKGKAAAQAERDAKVKAAVDAALKDPANKGKDPLVVQREAKSKAMKATKADYDAKIKPLTAERKAAYAAADKKAMGK